MQVNERPTRERDQEQKGVIMSVTVHIESKETKVTLSRFLRNDQQELCLFREESFGGGKNGFLI